jgi:hypothetical protein
MGISFDIVLGSSARRALGANLLMLLVVIVLEYFLTICGVVHLQINA